MRRPLRLAALTSLAALALTACSRASEDASSVAGEAAAGGMPPAAPSPDVAASKATGFALERRAMQDAPAPDAPPPAPAPAPAAGSGAQGAPAQTVVPSMLIRSGTASVEVRDLDRAMQQVTQLAASVGGFVANTSVQAGRDQVRSATIELRIPAARWDAALQGLEPLGDVESVNVTAEDVGEEYADIGARMTNARRLEERLLELLATRTGKLDDVLAVERELARVREEIERMEGRMRYLRTRAATSTLSVTIHEPLPVVGSAGSNPIVDAFRDAWVNFVGFVAWFIGALGFLIPLGALVLAAVALWRRFGPRRVPRAATTAESKP